MHWMLVKQDRAHRSFCALVWIVTGLYLILPQGGPQALLAWSVLVYFLGGAAAAYLVFGTFAAWAHKVLVQALLIALRPPGDAGLGLIRIAGVAVLIGEAVATYLAAVWAYGLTLPPA